MIRDLDCGRDVDGEEEGDDVQAQCVNELPLPDPRETSFDRGSHRQAVDNLPAVSMPENIAESRVAAVERDVVDDSDNCLPTPANVVDVGELATSEPDVDLVVARPRRERNQPKWMVSGEFDMGK